VYIILINSAKLIIIFVKNFNERFFLDFLDKNKLITANNKKKNIKQKKTQGGNDLSPRFICKAKN